MESNETKKPYLRLPVVSLSSEFLVMGHLMRRNILTYKAPPYNEGYDLICMHPNPKKASKHIRIQVKSRYQSDCDRGFPVKEKSLKSFDYLIVAFLNIGYFFSKHKKNQKSIIGRIEPEFYTFPVEFIHKHHRIVGNWEKVMTRSLDIEKYKNEKGFEQVAKELNISYPNKK
jgi:hypothetical protein